MSISLINSPITQALKYISQYINSANCQYISLPVDTPHSKQKLLTDLPEEILLNIAENLLPTSSSDNNWIEDIKNLQYTCTLFLRLGLIARNTYLLPFFDFKTGTTHTADEKITEWFSYTKNFRHEKLWQHLDSLIMSPTTKPFDICKVFEYQSGFHNSNTSLSTLIKLGKIQETEVQNLQLSKIQNEYITSQPAFWGMLKEVPVFSHFQKIPDNFLKMRNHEMIIKAFKENKELFEDIIKSKICLYYRDKFSNEEPFIEIIANPENAEVMRAIAPHVDLHASRFQGENAVHAIARKGNVDALEFLHQNNVDCKKRNYDGQSPIFFSVLYGNNAFTEKLIGYGESPDIQDKEGNTLLMYAIRKSAFVDSEGFFLKLIDLGAKLNATNNEGKNILHLFFESKNFREFVMLADIYKGKFSDSMNGVDIERSFFIKMVHFTNILLSKSHILTGAKDKSGNTPFKYLEKEFGQKCITFLNNIIHLK